MAIVFADRVKVRSYSTGTVEFILESVIPGYQSFAAIGDGNQCYYGIEDQAGNWEVGLGTYDIDSSQQFLYRNTVISSSNSNNLVNFAAGGKSVYTTLPSSLAATIGTGGVAEEFSFSVAADDSTLKTISNNESIKFIGSGTVTTSSDAEGNITITGSGGTALPLVTITNANYNQDDTPVAPATVEEEGAVVFTVTSSAALTATGLLLISGSNNKGGTIVPGGTSTGSQTLVFNMGVLKSVYTVIAFATTANGTSYSAPVAGNGGYVCFPAGTMITLSNGTKKAIEAIGYDDDILVWDFDLGVYASANPIWIKASETATEYNVLTFSDGSVLKTVGHHHLFNKQAERFTHTMTADTPIGTVSINEQGEEITLVSAEVVKESVEFYNVWTEYHLNMFAEGVLTSNRFNNTYPMVGMKFVKGNTELRSLEEFNGIDPKWINGLRLQEQTQEHTAEYIKWYISERLEKLSIDSVEMVA